MRRNPYRPGDSVKLASKLRPDLLPRDGDSHGVVVSAGLCSIVVAFNDFPEEPLYLGLKEVKRVVGTEPPAKKPKINKSTWSQW